MSDPSADETTRRPPLGPLRALGWLFVFSLVLVAATFGAVAYRLLAPEPAPVVTTVRATPDVVGAVQNLARLETARVHIERVVDLRDQSSSLFGLVSTEDAILLVAAADVSAGIDLQRMGDGDVIVDPDLGHVTLRLPAPEIFDARLDNERTYVHTRETSTFARPSAQLETRARREAERSLRASALEAGVLEQAQENAEITLRALVRSLGFRAVHIEFDGTTEER